MTPGPGDAGDSGTVMLQDQPTRDRDHLQIHYREITLLRGATIAGKPRQAAVLCRNRSKAESNPEHNATASSVECCLSDKNSENTVTVPPSSQYFSEKKRAETSLSHWKPRARDGNPAAAMDTWMRFGATHNPTPLGNTFPLGICISNITVVLAGI
ncbi:hypothetical protein AV530_001295 [Patagioenas fasciata monilis]|uniref:Uncharacterized protein n=1 Tax=Patagioenas fasciata monilis TaxID=372326 RepID=A0A1V4JQP9_PATFA|nr:hypothetical protein AV530_001295 [Patagioenas fasciata monilis]